MSEPYDARAYVADTSAWAVAHREAVREEWSAALRNRQIATCPIVKLELLYATKSGDDFDNWAANLAPLRDLAVTRSVTNAAEQAFRALAYVQPMYQRSVTIPDLLIAACAQDAGVGVLHYDEDFDRLADELAFESRWIASRGSL